MAERYVIIDASPGEAAFAALCLADDWDGLARLHRQIRDRTRVVANGLRGEGFEIVNCAAGNVTGHAGETSSSDDSLIEDIESLLGTDLPFRIGLGPTLKAAYDSLRGL